MSDLTDRLRHGFSYTTTDFLLVCEAADRIDQLETQLAAIDALHFPSARSNRKFCNHDGGKWPCRDHRIIHPEETP